MQDVIGFTTDHSHCMIWVSRVKVLEFLGHVKLLCTLRELKNFSIAEKCTCQVDISMSKELSNVSDLESHDFALFFLQMAQSL